MENPYSPSCVQVDPGPHTQTLESKPRLGKLTVFCVLVKVRLQILCKIGSQNKAWESCVPSCAPIQVLALIQRCALHKTLWPKNKDWKTYSVSCVLVKVHAPIQRCALHKILSPKKKGWKTYPVSCALSKVRTPIQNVCSAQTPFAKKTRIGKLTLFLVSWSKSTYWSKCVLSTKPFVQKHKDRKTYLVFLCLGQNPHTSPNVCSAQNPLAQKTRIGKLTLFLVSWSRSTHQSKGIPCTNSVVRTWRVLRSGITSGTYRNSSPCSKFLLEHNKGIDSVYSYLFLFTWFY